MKILDLNFIAQTFQAALKQANQAVGRVVIDSRDIQAGDVFFAIVGERFDGHDFVDQALAQGALLAITSRTDCVGKEGCLNVPDTEKALGKLAHAWRILLNPIVLGITGSSGKTTVKEMSATILRSVFGSDAVLATQGNLNNHLGVPLTLLRLNHAHRFAVVEMGMNHVGELTYLSKIAKPNIALINNVLNAHIGCGFASLTAIAQAKSELFSGLSSENGLAIFASDDPYFSVFQAASQAIPQRYFAWENAEICSANQAISPNCSDFDLIINQNKATVHLPVAGKHNIRNALAAAALLADWVNPAQIATALADFQSLNGRLKIEKTTVGANLINDCYNANPDSMKAALDVLAAFPAPRCFVMGDMGELGDYSIDFHREIGEYAAQLSIEKALFLGEYSFQAALSFGEKGEYFTDKNALIQRLKSIISPETTLLLKGSRFMKMEEIAQAL